MNKVILIGNVGSEPEMRFIPNGKPVTDFSLAVNRKYDGKEFTTWFKVVTWGKQAEFANQYVFKGQKLAIEGSVELEERDGQDGQKRSRMKVTASNVEPQTWQDRAETQDTSQSDEISPDDIPFS